MATVCGARLSLSAIRATRLIIAASRLGFVHRRVLQLNHARFVSVPIRTLPSASFSTSTPALSRVHHDEHVSEFFIVMESVGEKEDKNSNDKLQNTAYLKYERMDENSVELYSTFVPPQFEGQGVAALLAEAAFTFCLENNLKMKLSCSYLAHYVKKSQNSKYAKLVIP